VIWAYIKRSKNALKLGGDGLLKIITGLIIIKIMTNVNDGALLANFSQLKMITALLIAVSSSVFIIGLNKLSLKYKGEQYIGGAFILVLLSSLLISGCILVFGDEIQSLIGRSSNLFLPLLFILYISGFIANYLMGCKVKLNEQSSLANSKLYATTLSFISFLILYYCEINLWLTLFIYLILYYLYLSIILFKSEFFIFCTRKLNISKDLCIDVLNIYLLTVVSAIVFPSCILFFRYQLSLIEGWEVVSFWEAEWQLSSLMLLILSPILSVILTTFFTEKFKQSAITKKLLLKTISIFIAFSTIMSIIIYLLKDSLIGFLFNSELLDNSYSSSLLLLLIVNSLRLISVVMFYILYVMLDAKKLIFSELLFGFTFVLASLFASEYFKYTSLILLIPVLTCFLYLFNLLLSTNEYK